MLHSACTIQPRNLRQARMQIEQPLPGGTVLEHAMTIFKIAATSAALSLSATALMVQTGIT